MKRKTKRKVSTVVGCVLGGVTFTGPLAGELLYKWQSKRGLIDEPGWRRRYEARK